MDDKKMILGRASDVASSCINNYMIMHTNFLDAHQQSVIRTELKKNAFSCRTEFYGGFEDAERVCMICLPDWAEESWDENGAGETTASLGKIDSISTASTSGGVSATSTSGKIDICSEIFAVVRVSVDARAQVSSKNGRAFGHGDYLGSVLDTGLKREKVGDILIRDDGADIICLADIAAYIVRELSTVGRASVTCERVDISQIILPEKKFTEIHDTVASMRLDNVLSSAFKISRSAAVEAVKQGLVFVNYIEVGKIDAKIEEGDEITLRHKGRAKISEVGGLSRKGRINISILR